jgi:hypothetical protein
MRWRSAQLALVCALLCGCGSGSAVSAQIGMNPGTETNEDHAGNARAHLSEEAIFIHTFPEPNYPTPDTASRGRFEIHEGCLTFVTPGGRFRAVLQMGSQFVAPDSIDLGDGRPVKLGTDLVVKGAEGEFGLPGARPKTCPAKAMLLSEEITQSLPIPVEVE